MKTVPPIAMTQQYGPASLEGMVNKATDAKVLPPANLRGEFKNALEAKVNTWMGRAGTPEYTRMSEVLKGLLNPTTGKVDLSKVDGQTMSELKKLQGAAEGFESGFVKQLLGEMRKSSFAPKDDSTTDFAKDLMDQQIADSTAKGAHGLGIAQMVFSTMGEQLVRRAAGKAATTSNTGATQAPETEKTNN